MKRRLTSFLLLGVLAISLLTAGCKSHRPEPTQPDGAITLNEAPAVVRDGFRTKFPEAAIQTIDRTTTKDGNVRYNFTFTEREGNKRQAKFDASGRLLDAK